MKATSPKSSFSPAIGHAKSRSPARCTCAVVAAVALAAPVAAAASPAAAAASARTAAASSTSLVGICPNPVKIVTDWMPEVEQGAYYQLAASGGIIDKSAKTYTAPLIDPFNGQATGVKVELLAGGPALGYQQTPVVLNTQSSILMGADDLDTAIADSKSAPVVGIVAPLNNSLHILLWNPARYHFTGFASIKKSGVTVLFFKGTEFVEYMAGAGYISESQLDGSYTGTPARFIASDGGIVEQGFATAEPFIYTHETPQWDRAVAYELTSNTGYNPYSEMGEATPANIKKYAACFAKLVPMIQEGEVKFVTSPKRVDAIIVALNKAFNEIGGNYPAAVANYAVKTLLADKIVWQTPGEGFGSFDLGRVRQLISQLRPVLEKSGQSLPANFSPSSVMTNRFIDESIRFTQYKGPYNNTKGVIVVQGVK
jgi:hypothetical protein